MRSGLGSVFLDYDSCSSNSLVRGSIWEYYANLVPCFKQYAGFLEILVSSGQDIGPSVFGMGVPSFCLHADSASVFAR